MGKSKASAIEDRAYLDNAISTLVANIRFAAVDGDIRTICITSSIPNEGKSTVSSGLAEALANQGKRVLLVENDMHRRSLAGMLGAHARLGLYSVLVGQSTIQEAAVATKTNGLYFLDCEPHIPNPANVLASKRYRSFVNTAQQMFDYVVFDTPPVSTFVDGAIVGSIADATLLVVRNNFAKRDEVAASMEQLRKADANVIGTVFNFVASERSEYYYSYYTKDGKKIRKGKGEDGPKLRGSAAAAASEPTQAAAPEPAAQATTQAAAPTQSRFTRSAQSQQQGASGGAAAGVQPVRTASSRKAAPAPDSTEQFMINAGYLKNRKS